MQVWAVANQKGGVGKTTSVAGLGGVLAEEGHSVLLVDLDPHGSLTSYFKFNPDEVEQSSYDLFLHKGPVSKQMMESLIVPTAFQGLDILPSSTLLATLERQLGKQPGLGLVLKSALQKVADKYEYVLIDTPPLLGVLLVNAMAAAQTLILPVQTEHLAIKGLERMMRTLAMVMQSQKRSLPYWVVPTMFDRRTHASVQSLRILRNTYQGCIWPSAIMVDTRLRDASHAGVPPSIFEPHGRGAKAYRSLLKYIIEHDQISMAETSAGG